ncbi:hypothetical protein AGLY_013006 [Aphis glycines]|uniref:Uncharacterized protein n=1 Tax=Aphis glycines TaxID=307491 RepID=A0A6G0T9M4_APHGL|nr:hypothetical protein AGLY_013006 [Aphis glycines]
MTYPDSQIQMLKVQFSIIRMCTGINLQNFYNELKFHFLREIFYACKQFISESKIPKKKTLGDSTYHTFHSTQCMNILKEMIVCDETLTTKSMKEKYSFCLKKKKVGKWIPFCCTLGGGVDLGLGITYEELCIKFSKINIYKIFKWLTTFYLKYHVIKILKKNICAKAITFTLEYFLLHYLEY